VRPHSPRCPEPLQSALPSAVLGPWADSCQIEVSVVPTEDEREALTRYNNAAGRAVDADERATMTFQLTRDGQERFETPPGHMRSGRSTSLQVTRSPTSTTSRRIGLSHAENRLRSIPPY
jgi:hypothetical protein